MLDRAENLLHDHYGGREYWDVSMSPRALSARAFVWKLNSRHSSFLPP